MGGVAFYRAAYSIIFTCTKQCYIMDEKNTLKSSNKHTGNLQLTHKKCMYATLSTHKFMERENLLCKEGTSLDLHISNAKIKLSMYGVNNKDHASCLIQAV